MGGGKLLAIKYLQKIKPNLLDTEIEMYANDMVEMSKRYHFGFDEYNYFDFYDKTLDERLSFVQDIDHNYFCETLNKASNQYLFDDKGSSAFKFQKYYKRDFCVYYKQILGLYDINPFLNFIEKHKRFIIKPLSSGCGNGVKVMTTDNTDSKELFKTIISNYCSNILGGFIMEELIHQDDIMASLHPTSVNTVRITTVKLDNEVLIIHPFMRIGTGGKIVDNGGAGGLLCPIDVSNGKLICAADENNNRYSVHPDTQMPITEFQIPKWNEAILLAKELAQVVKGNRYCGWDLALTSNGWVMIEGNSTGQFVGWQIPTLVGFRKEANEILHKLNKKPL